MESVMKKDSVELSGFFDQGVSFTGELKFINSLRIDGKFDGKIISNDELIIGEKGEINAEIEVGIVSISGSVKGTIKAKDKVELLPSARVHANIVTKHLVISEGALFNGSCAMDEKGIGISAPVLEKK
jgi:cytoskeletal protein CcmA (bactofilin family)